MESLYTKYRPQTFADVVGQRHVVETLERAVLAGKTSHAYLFCGPRGTGKTTMARILAKALLCEQGPNQLPCGTCEQCQDIAHDEHPDVHEMDAASRTGVDDVRSAIIQRVDFAPVRGRYQVFIIDEVHMLSTAAFNALLKTLEEPPAHIVFILCTTDPQKVPATILSRVQRFDFHSISDGEIADHLASVCEREGFTADPAALELVARHARGGMRDALSMLEQLSISEITVQAVRAQLGEVAASTLDDLSTALARRDVAALFAAVARLSAEGSDLLQFARDFASHVRDLYVISIAGANEGIVSASGDRLVELARQAAEFGGPDRLARALSVLGDTTDRMRYLVDQRLELEVAFTKIARPESELTLEALAERVEQLELRVSGGQPLPPLGAPVAASPQAVPTASPQVQAALVAEPQRSAEARPVAAQPEPTVPSEQVAQPAPAAPAVQPAPAPKPAAPQETAGQPSVPDLAAPASSDFVMPWSSEPADQASQEAPEPVSAPIPAPEPAPAPRSNPAPQPAMPASQPAASAPQPVQTSPAPAPQPESSDAASQGSSGVSGADLLRCWKRANTILAGKNPAYHALLLQAVPASDDGEVVTIELPENNNFIPMMLKRNEVNEAVCASLSEAFGGPRSFTTVASAAPAAAPRPVVPDPMPSRIHVPDSSPQPQPAPAPQPQPAPAPQPQSALPSQEAPLSAPWEEVAPAPAGDWDQVPYDDADYVPYDDEAAFGDTVSPASEPVSASVTAVPAPVPVPAPAPAPVPNPGPAPAPAPAPAPNPGPDPAPTAAASSRATNEEDARIIKMLEEVFGKGITFKRE